MYLGAQYTNGLTDQPIGIRVEINGVASLVPLDLANIDYQNIMALVEAGDLVIAPADLPVVPVPTFVTLAQARRQLRALNAFTQIDAAANADLASAVCDAWNYGNGVTRGEVLADFVQSTLGWADTQMDDFMTSASEIRL